MEVRDLIYAVSYLVSKMMSEQRAKLSSKDGKLGAGFAISFREGHPDIHLGRARKQEEIRYRSYNIDALTVHILMAGNLTKLYDVSATRIANLDARSCTPRKDCNGTTVRKVFTRSNQRHENRESRFKHIDRITVLPVVFSDGTTGKTMFVFKRKLLRVLTVRIANGTDVSRTIAEYIARESLACQNDDVAGVDSNKFLQFSQLFVEDVKDLTANGRKVMLLYDGYRSHLGWLVLQTLEESGVIAVALPSHIRGITPPLDSDVYPIFKDALNDCIRKNSRTDKTFGYTEVDIAAMMRYAMEHVFTSENIVALFRKTGIWPFNPDALLRAGLPMSKYLVSKLCSAEEIRKGLEGEQRLLAAGLGLQEVRISGSFLDSDLGQVLTFTQTIAMQKDAEERRLEQRRATAQRVVDRENKMKANEEKRPHKEAQALVKHGERRKRMALARDRSFAALAGMSLVANQSAPRWSKKERGLF